ncbi:hypothetical protein K7432_017762 [Basidiobolus ranarum]|uniref:Uncharacterized protein n=1 Tax=Basidiobolus ranarum TaxID=34480 RepID=A0ABR2VJW9_9FUNG
MPEPLTERIYINHIPNKATKSPDFIIHLTSYTFFTKWIYEVDSLMALGASYAEGMWTCNNPAGFLSFIMTEMGSLKVDPKKEWLLYGMACIRHLYPDLNQNPAELQLNTKKLVKSYEYRSPVMIVADNLDIDMKRNRNSLVVTPADFLHALNNANSISHVILLSPIPSSVMQKLQQNYPDIGIVTLYPFASDQSRKANPLDTLTTASTTSILKHFWMLLMAVLIYIMDQWGFKLVANFAPNTTPYEMNSRFRSFVEAAIEEKLEDTFKNETQHTSKYTMDLLQSVRYERAKQIIWYAACP